MSAKGQQKRPAILLTMAGDVTNGVNWYAVSPHSERAAGLEAYKLTMESCLPR